MKQVNYFFSSAHVRGAHSPAKSGNDENSIEKLTNASGYGWLALVRGPSRLTRPPSPFAKPKIVTRKDSSKLIVFMVSESGVAQQLSFSSH